MEYSWGLLVPSIALMVLFVVILYFKIGMTGLIVSQVVVELQGVPREFVNNKTKLLEDLTHKYDKVGGYLKDNFTAAFLIIVTILTKLLDYDVVWAPFWGSVFFCGYLVRHYISLSTILHQTKQTATTIQQQLLVALAMQELSKKGLNIDDVPQPDLTLTRNEDFDINS